MTEHKSMTHKEAMHLTKEAFIARCIAWMDEFNDGQLMKVENPSKCPVQIWIEHNRTACGKEIVPTTTQCEVCGGACCPECHNHSCMQLSRVTGYMGSVDSWNAGKKQEFLDRKRFEKLDGL